MNELITVRERTTAIERIERIRSLVAATNNIPDLKKIIDTASAIHHYTKQQQLGKDIEREALSIKMEALKKLGELLKEMPKNKGTKGSFNGRDSSGGTKMVPPENIPTLDQLGLNKKISSLAQQVAELTEEETAAIIEGVISISEAIKKQKKEQRKEDRKLDLITKTLSLPAGTFNIIYCDPPWQYDFAETDNRKIENQYPTMDIEEICKMPLPEISEDALLLMWATAPKLCEALKVIEAWDFIYKTHSVWDKEKIGMGYWFRGQHELLLVAVRGEFSPPEVEFRNSSIYREARQGHSSKPIFYYEWIEQAFEGNKIELFARNKRAGWEAWGNE